MIPKAGGFYVYAGHDFGRYGGFVVGWSDWLNNTLGLSFISVVFGEYAARLFAPDLSGGRIIFSVSVIIVVAILNLIGLRAGCETQKIASFLKAVALIGFVAACFAFGGQNQSGGDGANRGRRAGIFFRVLDRFYPGFSARARNLRRLIFGNLFFRGRYKPVAKSAALAALVQLLINCCTKVALNFSLNL